MQRRDWIKQTFVGILGTSLGLNARGSWATQNGRRLVLVELAGANDGLNTLVPVRNDHYYRLRPNLALSSDAVTGISDDLAIHNSLQPLMALWEQGELAWLQGLGYPAPNRSHFKSIELWESGGDGQAAGRRGWITHDIEHSLGRDVADAHGISLVNSMGLFNSNGGRWLSMNTPAQLLVKRETADAATAQVNSALRLVNDRMQELDTTLTALQSRIAKVPKVTRIGRGPLGTQLQHVLQLVRAGIDTPVYRVRLGGFDTHQGQLGRHRTLLTQLGYSLADFRDALKRDNEWDNTLVLTYSEFGRRASENQSGGTDHGTAAPHMMMGGALNGGLYSSMPDLGRLVDGDPAHTMDYRSVYQSVLSDWFDVRDNQFKAHDNTALHSLIRNRA